MPLINQTVANTVCQWEDDAPLAWTMSETTGKGDEKRTETEDFDLTALLPGFEASMLLGLKELLMQRRRHVSLGTILSDYTRVRSLLTNVQHACLFTGRVKAVDEAFLIALQTLKVPIAIASQEALMRLFRADCSSSFYAPGLTVEDFPIRGLKKGRMGRFTASILEKALTRAACVEVLKAAEDAYEAGALDIGHFSFLHLALHVFCRPKSYRQITISDLQIDIDPATGVRSHFLWIAIAKSKTAKPKRISYRLNQLVGDLLELQRARLIDRYGHLFARSELGKLAMFPSHKMGVDGTWWSKYSAKHHGQAAAGSFSKAYLYPLVNLQHSVKFNFVALRHTVGTQLAEAGCSSTTIQAVLKHASPTTCQAYVDIAFQGLRDQLSDSMKDGFERSFPVFDAFRSKKDPIAAEKAIRSEDLETGETELTGECGRTLACNYAPLACYACPRFIPCYDADHSINLRAIDSEIALCKQQGLPFQQMLNRAKDSRRYIILVSAAAERKQAALQQEELV